MNTRSSSNKSKRIGFEIYSDISENRKKRTLSNKDGNKAHKSSSKSSKIVFKKPILDKNNKLDKTDKENAVISNIQNTMSTSVIIDAGLKKTIEISHAERNMTGAPEGELFDVRLLADSDILPSEQPLQDAQRFINQHMNAVLW